MAAIGGRVPATPLVTESFSTEYVPQEPYAVHMTSRNCLYFRQNILRVRYQIAGNVERFRRHCANSRGTGRDRLAERPLTPRSC